MGLNITPGLSVGNGLSAGLRLSRGVGLVGNWTPAQLGVQLLAYYDAERTDTIALSGAFVTAWNDAVAGFSLTAAGSVRPTYSATSFNGRPGITFDGADDILLNTGAFPATWPAGSTSSWIWGLADQQRAAGVVTTDTILRYGNPGTTATRRLTRTNSVDNRGASGVATSSNEALSVLSTPFTGSHVVVAKATDTTLQCNIDGVAGAIGTGLTIATSGARAAIGGATNGGNFFLGVLSVVAITTPLSTSDELLFLNYLMARI